GLVAFGPKQPLPQLRPLPVRIERRHLDHAVRAVALAVAAADAGVADVNLAVGRAVDRVRRAILHAVRMLAVPARGRHVDLRVGWSRFAIETRRTLVHVGAGFLAVVAADAQALVDQQHVGRLADALLHEITRDGPGLNLLLHRHVGSDARQELRLDLF